MYVVVKIDQIFLVANQSTLPISKQRPMRKLFGND